MNQTYAYQNEQEETDLTTGISTVTFTGEVTHVMCYM